jgi:hypothetical protein
MAQGTTTNRAGANTGRMGNSQLLADMYDLSPYGYYGLTPEQQNVDSYRGPEPGREAVVARAGGAAPGQKQGLINMAQMLTKNKNMQVSKAGVPYKYIVPPVNPQEDPGYLRPPTQQDIEYGERLHRAREQEATGVYPTGYDPVLVEQRITAAERQPHGPGWKEDITDPLRKRQYGPSKLQNIGDILKGTYSNTLGRMVPFAYGPGGSIYNAAWSHRPNEALPIQRGNILRGEGTITDQMRAASEKGVESRKQNVYDELGMPQPKPIEAVPAYDVGGQRDIPLNLTDMGQGTKEKKGKKKETFNLLKFLLGLLGLPLKLLGLGGGPGDEDKDEEEEAKPKSSDNNWAYNQMMQQRQNNAYYQDRLKPLMSRPTSMSSAGTTGKQEDK